MNAIDVELPEPAFQSLTQLAQKANLPLKDFASRALQEAIAANLDRIHLEERARRGSWEKFQAVMDKVPDVEPSDYDKF